MSHRRLALVAALVVAPALAARAQAPNAEAATAIRKEYLKDLDSLQSKFLQLAAAFPADKYSWRPGPGVRSVGEVFMHIASEYYYWGVVAYGGQRSPVIARGQEALTKFEQNSSKDSVAKYLKDGLAFAKQTITAIPIEKLTGTQSLFGQQTTIIETTIVMTDDLHEHLGQLIAYARMNGIKPPWTK